LKNGIGTVIHGLPCAFAVLPIVHLDPEIGVFFIWHKRRSSVIFGEISGKTSGRRSRD
jgi:hypothetical protein